MGEVFLAEHVKLGRKEALKILKPSLAADTQFVARFRREARAVNRLRHPNIIAIYDFGQLPDGRFYLAMEYADGQAVHDLLKRDDHFEVAARARACSASSRTPCITRIRAACSIAISSPTT